MGVLPEEIEKVIRQVSAMQHRLHLATLGRVPDRRCIQVAYEGEDRRKGPRRSAEIRAQSQQK